MVSTVARAKSGLKPDDNEVPFPDALQVSTVARAKSGLKPPNDQTL